MAPKPDSKPQTPSVVDTVIRLPSNGVVIMSCEHNNYCTALYQTCQELAIVGS
ncbi:hypothetical protein LZ32DRAFT_599277 [Colletotrichum eremochloae]|nr:hypothetical protein LZ32DRAFT_599277 [Colletotrichum eremochloae]